MPRYALGSDRPILSLSGGRLVTRWRRLGLLLAPDTGKRGLDLLLDAGDELAVGVDQRLFGFNLGDDGFLGGEGWEGNLNREIVSLVYPL